MTNIDGLYRIPASIDLGTLHGDSTPPEGWRYAPIPGSLARRGFDHFGDLSWYGHREEGFLCVPVEGGQSAAVLAFFRASDLRFMGEAPIAADRREAAFCAIDGGGHVVLPARGSAVFRRYRVDWDDVAAGRPGLLVQVGELTLRLENGASFSEWHFGGAAFSDDGRLLYVLTGYYDDHYCPIWDPRFWRGTCEIDAELGGIHVFDVRSTSGGLCRGAEPCEGARLGRSYNSSDLARGGFRYLYRGEMLHGEEPEGITVWDLDATGAPAAPGISGQVHALMLDNELFTAWDRVSLRHYRADVECPPL